MIRALIFLFWSLGIAGNAVELSKVIDVGFDDFDGDFIPDQLVLVRSDANRVVKSDPSRTVDLLIYLSTAENHEPIVIPSIAYLDEYIWQIPSLEMLQKTHSFQVISQNCGDCEKGWKKVLTVSYRNHDFVISGYNLWAGYNLSVWGSAVWGSRLSEGIYHTSLCDVNLLTGQYRFNRDIHKLEGKVKPKKLLLKNYFDDFRPQICIDLIKEYYFQ